mgnify:CR=1 FL=1
MTNLSQREEQDTVVAGHAVINQVAEALIDQSMWLYPHHQLQKSRKNMMTVPQRQPRAHPATIMSMCMRVMSEE